MAKRPTKRPSRRKLYYKEFMEACYRAVLRLGLASTWQPSYLFYEGTATFDERMKAWRQRVGRTAWRQRVARTP